MAVQLYEKNQAVINYCSNPLKILPDLELPLIEQIKNHFLDNMPLTEEFLNVVDSWLEFYFRKHNRRYSHSISTAETAVEIARTIGYINPLKAKLAGMLHDIAKSPVKKMTKNSTESKYAKLNENLESIGIKLLDSEKVFYQNKKARVKALHAPIGSLMAERKLGVQDAEVLNAIRFHTSGINLDHLSILSKIILLADKIEPVKRGTRTYGEIMEVLRVTKNIDIALNALKNRLKEAA